ncbi:MAG: hypothetical protein AB1468_03090 [Candidatus Micrarchaeota archaeon]
MRYALLLFALFSLACYSFAVIERPLTAQLVSGTSLSVDNCGSGAPSQYQLRFSITNTHTSSVRVMMDYYDFSKGEWVNGTAGLCNLAAGYSDACTGTLHISMGGMGTGTVEREMVRLRAFDPDDQMYVYTKTFSLTLNHYATPGEENIADKMTTASAAITEADSLFASRCSGGLCCGKPDAKSALDSAKIKYKNANSSLRVCDTANSYALAAVAINDARNATNLINACKLSDGAECTSDEECESGVCVNGRCGSAPVQPNVTEKCGNGVCDAGESYNTCPGDCKKPTGPRCGDGTCSAGETYTSCPEDCEAPTTPPGTNATGNETGAGGGKTCGIFYALLGLVGFVLLKR